MRSISLTSRRALLAVAAVLLPSLAGAQQRLAAGTGVEPTLARATPAPVEAAAPRADAQPLIAVDAATRGLLIAALSEISREVEDSPKRGRDEVKLWGADTLGALCVQFRDAGSRRTLAPDAAMLGSVNLRSHRRTLAMGDCPPTPARVVMPRDVPASDSAFYVSEVARVPVPQQVTVMRWTVGDEGAVVEALAWYEGRGRHMRCTMTPVAVAGDWRGGCELVAFVRE
jgi:hypothetical protein